MSLPTQREDFLLTLPNFQAATAEEYKQRVASLFPSGTNLFESDADRSNFLKSFIRNIRIFLERQISKTTTEGTNFYNKDTHEILRFTFWAAKASYIDTTNAFVIMEDIYDCLAMEEISSFFEFLEELTSTYETFTSSQHLAFLRIGNSILKKFSKVHDNDFRGRVQLFLSKITQLSEKTAVNLKSSINVANVTNYSSTVSDDDNVSKELKSKDFKELSNLRVSFSAYRKFWELQKFLQNPTLLFSDDSSVIQEQGDITDENEIVDGEQEVMEIENLTENPPAPQTTVKETKIAAFCKFVNDMIEIFRKDPIPEAKGILRLKGYPKYLTKYSLLNIQLKDATFRKSWLTQIITCLSTLRNPLKLTQKKGLEIKEEDMEKINDLEKKLFEYIREIPRLNQNDAGLEKQINFFLEREKNWTLWKESNCPPLEKPPAQNATISFSSMLDQANLGSTILSYSNDKQKPELYPNYKEKEKHYKMVKDASNKFLKDTNFDRENPIFGFLTKPQLPQQVDDLEPGVDYYFNTFLSEMKDPTLAEEDKLASDQISVWRGMRVLARNSLNLFSTPKTEVFELKLDDILKKMMKNEPAGASEKPDGEGQEAKSEAKPEAKSEPKPLLEEKQKSDKEETKKDVKEVKETPTTEMTEEKPEVKENKEQKKDIKMSEVREEKAIEKPAIRIETRSEPKVEGLSITNRIRSKGDNDKNQERGDKKTIQHTSRRRSPENHHKDHDRQPNTPIESRIEPKSDRDKGNKDRANENGDKSDRDETRSNQSVNRKRSPDHNIKDLETQSSTNKKTKV